MTVVAADGPEDFIMSIQSNTFCWHGISTDVDAGAAFYTGVLGWTVASDGPGAPMFVAPGGAVAHLQAPENGPPSWCSFLAVDDLDASTSLAAERGGSVLVPPTDLPAGRFSVVTTPSGAVFGLYRGVDEDVQATLGPGSIHWVELRSTAPEADVAWFGAVFGLGHRVEQMARGPYRVLEADGVARGGVTSVDGEASVFLAWVQVDDLEASLGRVAEHGGSIVSEVFVDPAIGRMTVVADPSGATFGLIQPN